MNELDDGEEGPEHPFFAARRMMFAYLSGIMKGDDRAAFKAAWESDHAKHTKRNGACPMCETKAAIDAISYESPFFKVIPRA